MNKPIASIAWPTSPDEAARALRLYMIQVLERLRITFPPSPYEPISVAKELLTDEGSEDRRRSALGHWWKIVDENGIRNFESKDVLTARLAICLLAPTELDVSMGGEQLSWFLEVLGFLNLDVDEAIEVMERQFTFT